MITDPAVLQESALGASLDAEAWLGSAKGHTIGATAGPWRAFRMRLWILSDLHLEFGPVELPRVEADVVVLAGDVHKGRRGLAWARERFAATPVVYVLGNHEYYGEALPRLREKLEGEAAGSSVHLLENRAVEIGGVTFLGCTLWTDFELHQGSGSRSPGPANPHGEGGPHRSRGSGRRAPAHGRRASRRWGRR